MFAIYGRKLLFTIDAHEGLKRDLGGRVSNITLKRNLLFRPPHRRRSERGSASESEGVWGERGAKRARSALATLLRTGDFVRQNVVAAGFMRSSVVREHGRPLRFAKHICWQRFFLVRCPLRSQSESRIRMEPSSRRISTGLPESGRWSNESKLGSSTAPPSPVPTMKQPPSRRYMNMEKPVISAGPHR